MYFITNLVHQITTPIRMIFYWIMRCVPVLKGVPQISLPMRLALMTFLFLLIVFVAGVCMYMFSPDRADKSLLIWLVAGVLAFVIPFIVYYLVKFLMIKEESRFPDIERVFETAMQEAAQQGIFLAGVPLFLVQGARDHRQAAEVMQSTQLPIAVTVPQRGNSDISVFATQEAMFLFVTGCSCISRLSSAPQVSASASNAASPDSPVGGTIDIDQLTGGAGLPASPAEDLGQTLEGGFPVAAEASPGGEMHPAMQSGSGDVGGTMLLPDGMDFSTASSPGSGGGSMPTIPMLTSQDIFDREQKLRFVCKLITESRQSLCPINGLITLLPFELIESACSQLQTASQKDMAVLRDALLVRCANTVVVTQLEKEEGFQELVKRVGEERTRDFRFGKGCELWNAPKGERLEAIASHAVGAFEDWIYMLFQEENALKHRYNSRLFMLLCRIRGQFAQNLRAVLARGFGFEPETESNLAYEQFLFSGCYFAAAGSGPGRQAFIKSVFRKSIQQEGELEWAPEALRRDRQAQFAANMFALLGMVSLVAILVMVLLRLSGPGPGA